MSSEEPSSRPATPVTWGLVAANVVVFALETAWGGSQSGPTLYRMGAILGRGALPSEPWRIVSSAFLHIGPVHLLLNMWALVAFRTTAGAGVGTAAVPRLLRALRRVGWASPPRSCTPGPWPPGRRAPSGA